jgi:hypothetical protein
VSSSVFHFSLLDYLFSCQARHVQRKGFALEKEQNRQRLTDAHAWVVRHDKKYPLPHVPLPSMAPPMPTPLTTKTTSSSSSSSSSTATGKDATDGKKARSGSGTGKGNGHRKGSFGRKGGKGGRKVRKGGRTAVNSVANAAAAARAKVTERRAVKLQSDVGVPRSDAYVTIRYVVQCKYFTVKVDVCIWLPVKLVFSSHVTRKFRVAFA